MSEKEPKPFVFGLGTNVEITVSGERGQVIGCAHYMQDENRYLVRYRNLMGQATEQWWGESALQSAPQ